MDYKERPKALFGVRLKKELIERVQKSADYWDLSITDLVTVALTEFLDRQEGKSELKFDLNGREKIIRVTNKKK